MRAPTPASMHRASICRCCRQLAGCIWSGPLSGVCAGRQYVVDYLLLATLIAALCVSEFMDPFERSVYHKTDAVGSPPVICSAAFSA